MASDLNERAAKKSPRREALWHVDDGWAVFAGPLHHNDMHAHSTAVLVAGLYGSVRLRIAGSAWMTCRSAVIRAGTPYEFDAGGEPLGVFYLEPSVAGADALAPLVAGGDETAGGLVGNVDVPLLRAAFEQRAQPSAGDLRAAVSDTLAASGRRSRRSIDARISRSVRALQLSNEPASAGEVAASVGLSASRFQHLFTAEVGVPFRRYRGWQRLRAAIRSVAAGSNLTAAAHAAGFADQAHFSRAFRTTFGAPPSTGL